MNWLSHIFLSKNDIDYQLGNLLADALEGPVWDDANEMFIEGVAMHRAIDTFTDSHEIVSRSKARLGKKGYLKGVVVDVLYDHYLSRNWDLYSSTPLPEYLDTFHDNAVRAAQSYPKPLRRFVEALVASGRLSRYHSFEGFTSTLKKMEGRLSKRIRNKETTMDYIPVVNSVYEELEKDFLSYFPELISFVKDREPASNSIIIP